MSRDEIPVDLFNPGQVFACLGLVELCERLGERVRAGFDWSAGAPARFGLASSEPKPIEHALAFLGAAEVHALLPPGQPSPDWPWGVPLREAPPDCYPVPLPGSPATWAALLSTEDHRVRVDHWGDEGTRRDRVKLWAGAAGMPGAQFLENALTLVRDQLQDGAALAQAALDPFSVSAGMSSSFRFDWRGSYVPLDAGFSLNKHKSALMTLGYPLVEVLAALGLSQARPAPEPRDKLHYRYHVLASGPDLLPPALLRAALGSHPATQDFPCPYPLRTFRIHLDWPGKEGQARSITHTTEES